VWQFPVQKARMQDYCCTALEDGRIPMSVTDRHRSTICDSRRTSWRSRRRRSSTVVHTVDTSSAGPDQSTSWSANDDTRCTARRFPPIRASSRPAGALQQSRRRGWTNAAVPRPRNLVSLRPSPPELVYVWKSNYSTAYIGPLNLIG